MNVNFYKINKKVNSTLIPSGTGTQINVVLKSPSSIINPRFELNQYLDVNYCYVAEFNRYYFINEIRYENPLWVYSCNVDVLASFKTEIGASTKYVLRSASQRNELITDTLFPSTKQITMDGQMIPSIVGNINSGYFVIGIIGDNSSGQTLYQTNSSGFRTILSTLLTTADGNYEWGDLTQGVINSIMNPFEYIASCRWYPFSMNVGAQVSSIKAGLWECKTPVAPVISVSSADSNPDYEYQFLIKKHPQTLTRGQYVNQSPFTTGFINLPNFGLIPLDMDLLIDMYMIRVLLFVDPYTGIATAYGFAEDEQGALARRLVFKRQANFGINIPLSKNDNKGLGTFLSGLVGTGLGIGMAVATGGAGAIGSASIGMALGSGASAIGGIGEIAGNFNGVSETTSSIGNISEHLRPSNSYFYFVNQTEIDITNRGRPLYSMRTINTLSGYLICNDGNINSNATEQEKESIASYLTSGFYYE